MTTKKAALMAMLAGVMAEQESIPMLNNINGLTYGIPNYRKHSKPPLTKKQKKVRLANKRAKQARRNNR